MYPAITIPEAFPRVQENNKKPRIVPCDFIPKSSAIRLEIKTTTPPAPSDRTVTNTPNNHGFVTGKDKRVIAESRQTQVRKALLLPILSAIRPTETLPTGSATFILDNIKAAFTGEMPLSIA